MPARRTAVVFWFTLPAVMVQPAIRIPVPLAGKRIAIVSRNKVLREGLRLQIETQGGEGIDFSQLPPGGRIDAVLIDAGTDSAPESRWCRPIWRCRPWCW